MTKDVFDDSEDKEVETEESNTEAETEEEETEESEDESDEDESEEETDESEEESEGEEESETPNDKAAAVEKFIPESRFKAAIANVSNELDETKRKLAQYETAKVPNKEEDPEGHAVHMKTVMSAHIMRKAYPDYDAKVGHFKEMAKNNPMLNNIVAASDIPAETAYRIAEEDLEITKLKEVSKSESWAKFQKWEKEQAKLAKANAPEKEKAEGSKKVDEKLTKVLRVPNLNKATSVSKRLSSKDDDVFAGSAF